MLLVCSSAQTLATFFRSPVRRSGVLLGSYRQPCADALHRVSGYLSLFFTTMARVGHIPAPEVTSPLVDTIAGPGGERGLVSLPVFKTGAPWRHGGWVRFPSASAALLRQRVPAGPGLTYLNEIDLLLVGLLQTSDTLSTEWWRGRNGRLIGNGFHVL